MTAVRILVGLLPFVLTTLVMAQTVTVDFSDREGGKPPQGFATALTGSGKVGKGDMFETYLNGTKLFEVTDKTFQDGER